MEKNRQRMPLWYRIRRRMFRWLKPKNLEVVVFPGVERAEGTGLREPEFDVSWGSVLINGELAKQLADNMWDEYEVTVYRPVRKNQQSIPQCHQNCEK